MIEEKKIRSEGCCEQGLNTAAAKEPEALGIVDLGRASEQTRGQISGFIVEPSAFPLRDF